MAKGDERRQGTLTKPAISLFYYSFTNQVLELGVLEE